MYFPHFNEMELLCNALAEGKCRGEDLRHLEELVLSSDAAAQYYVRFFNIHSEIKNAHLENNHQDRLRKIMDCLLFEREKNQLPSGKVSAENEAIPKRQENASIFPLLDLESMLIGSSAGTPSSSEPSQEHQGGGPWRNFGSYVPITTSLISILLILGIVLVLPIYWSQKTDHGVWDVIARVKQTAECHWKNKENSFSKGTFLISGQQLDLEFGLVEIEFSSGARVLLQGPVQFIATNRNEAQLVHGRLTASVPKKADGFTVFTPQHEVVDLGTEFGVLVGENIDERTEIHVFKGLVEVEANVSQPSKTTIKLSTNQAIACDPKTNQITSIPVNSQAFVRDLDLLTGVTFQLNPINPSFEFPDIRTLPEFQLGQGDTDLMKIQGWKYSGIGSDGLPVIPDRRFKSKPYAGYQISPYKSPNQNEPSNVGPGATDGRQVIAVKLGPTMKSLQQTWLYQSLGVVGVKDVGRTLLLEVDAGPRTGYSEGTGTLLAGFATQVTQERAGIHVVAPGILNVSDDKQGMKTIQTTLPINSKLVGQELFIVLTAINKKDSQYHFDNVRISVVPPDQKDGKN